MDGASSEVRYQLHEVDRMMKARRFEEAWEHKIYLDRARGSYSAFLEKLIKTSEPYWKNTNNPKNRPKGRFF